MGRINLHSPDHVSLLVHRTFNVSIPREHIPSSHWEFQHGAAENDPEFGWGANDLNASWKTPLEATENDTKPAWTSNTDDGGWGNDWTSVNEKKDTGSSIDDSVEDVSAGAWVDNFTGEKLGGSSRMVEFAVIG